MATGPQHSQRDPQSNPGGEMLNEASITLSLLREKFPTKKSLWDHLFCSRKLHLPHFFKRDDKDKCLTWDYLIDVLCRKVVTMTRIGVTLRDHKKVAASCEEIAELIKKSRQASRSIWVPPSERMATTSIVPLQTWR